MSDAQKVKPLFIIKPHSMVLKDIRRAERLAGIVIAECSDPESIRLVEPPIHAEVPAQARAALRLMRYVIHYPSNNAGGDMNFSRHHLMQKFLTWLVEEEPPKSVPLVPSVKSVKK